MDHGQGIGSPILNTDIGTIVYSPGSALGPKNQDCYQLVLLQSGSVTVRIDESTHVIPPGQTVYPEGISVRLLSD